jgi:hypothetical protein
VRADVTSQYRIDLTVLVRAKSREDAKSLGRSAINRLKTKGGLESGAGRILDVDVIDVRAV